MEDYNMTNLRPDSLRDESEREYILGKIEEKEKQTGGLECVLTFEYHPEGGFRFNTKTLSEVEEKQDDSAPKIIKYWKKEKFMAKKQI